MGSVAIDGPAGAGKSTIARAVARELGYIYVDTGALYRAIGLFALEHGVAPDDGPGVEGLLKQVRVELRYFDGEQRVFLGEEDVSEAIRRPEISMAASGVSAIPAVRAFLFDLQRDMARRQSVVMDGRDIGTVVLPDAPVKIFLTAAPEERAMRRFRELQSKGLPDTYEEVLADVRKRDKQDSSRPIAPLCQAADAVLVDTTGISLEQSVEKLLSLVKEKLGDAV